MKRTSILLTATATATASAGCSAAYSGYTDAQLGRLIVTASEDRAHMVERIAGPPGFIGVVIQGNDPGARRTTAWITDDGRYLLIGSLLDVGGREVRQTRGTQREPDAASSRELLRSLERAAAVVQFPQGTRTLFVFSDADCVFCLQLFQQISERSDEFKKRSIRLRWIMVGIRGTASTARGAEILKEGLPGLQLNEARFDVSSSVGGILSSNDPELLRVVSDNGDLLSRVSTNRIGTPTLVWQGSRGLQVRAGAPTEEALLGILEDIGPDVSPP